jgi:hypothetical protein
VGSEYTHAVPVMHLDELQYGKKDELPLKNVATEFMVDELNSRGDHVYICSRERSLAPPL